MEPRVLPYERPGAYRRRWPAWLAVAGALALAFAAPAIYHVATPSHVGKIARSTDEITLAQSLSALLSLYALRHDDKLPASLEQLEAEGVYNPGYFRRLPDGGQGYLVYQVRADNPARPFLIEYRGAGVSMKSEGVVVIRFVDRLTSPTFVTSGGERLRWAFPTAP
jgi:hypothetical protein